MPLTISDPDLEKMGMTEDEARVEIACRMYDCGKLSFGPAIRWSGLTRTAFESALIDRGLPVYRITEEMLREELEAADNFGK